MKTRILRDIEVSEVGMGCMAFSHGYGQIPPEEYSVEAIQNACQNGCTFFDTAEIYSPNLSGIGHNERIVGKALHEVREQVVIATKLFLNGFEAIGSGLGRTGWTYIIFTEWAACPWKRLRKLWAGS